jgi:hypothetical protein
MSSTDFAGVWGYKGTLNPSFNEWQQFPQGTNSGNSLVRLTYYGEVANIKSWGFLRCSYSLPNTNLDSNWYKIYPKEQTEILIISVPQEFLITADNVTRYFQVIKRLKPPYRRWVGTVIDESWAVSLEVLELLSLSQQVQDAILEPEPKVLTLTNQNTLIILGGN